MADSYNGPYGGYTNVTGVIAATPAGQVSANIDKLLALIPVQPPVDKNNPQPAPAPVFGRMDPVTAHKLRLEITALKTAIGAAPTS